VTLYGTEAMHVLRAEKGYIIVGQETDGTVTPFDLGMDWIVQEVLPEGAQLVEKVLAQPPMPMLGHVTSSYYSPNCGRSIAMALVKGGRARIGETLYAPLGQGRTVPCVVAESPVFFDPEGERLK
jgi:sarcosine oxidase, subunit alpha